MKKSNDGRINKGFTLIELLVTISIIGILAAITATAIGGIESQSRDAQEKSDLNKIASALEHYRSDQDYYPNQLSIASLTSLTNQIGYDTTQPKPTTTVTYLSPMPHAPGSGGGGGTDYCYQSYKDYQTYQTSLSSSVSPCDNSAGNMCEYYILAATMAYPGSNPGGTCGSATYNYIQTP